MTDKKPVDETKKTDAIETKNDTTKNNENTNETKNDTTKNNENTNTNQNCYYYTTDTEKNDYSYTLESWRKHRDAHHDKVRQTNDGYL